MTERILVPKTPSFTARVEQRVEPRHRLHQADAVLLGLEPLVDLQEGDDAALLPQEGRDRLSLHLAVHRAFEQDRPR